MAGYSSRRLTDKLGITAGTTVLVAHEPADVDLESLLLPLPEAVRLRRRKGPRPVDMVLCFAESRRDVQSRLPVAAETIDRAGAVWMIWPKPLPAQPAAVPPQRPKSCCGVPKFGWLRRL